MAKTYNNYLSVFFTRIYCIIVAIFIGACSEHDDAASNVNRHLANSKNYLQQGQYRAAILEARNALDKSPSTESATHLAQLYLDMGLARSAINLLENFESKNDKLLLKLADAYIHAQKYSSATKTLNEVSDNAQQSASFHLFSGLAAAGLGDYGTAKKHFEKTLSLDAANEKVLISQLVLALKQNDEAAAEHSYTQLKIKFNNSPESLLLLAKIEYQKSNFPLAEEFLMTAIHNTQDTDVMLPVKSSILQLLIETLTQQGRFADAVPFNKLISEANPGWQESQEAINKVVHQIQLGNWGEAESLLKEFKESFPDNHAAQSLLGLVSLQKGDFKDANAILENAVDPETASPMMVSASVLSKLGSNEKLEVFTILEEALSTKPNNTKLLSMYGALALELKDKELEGEKKLLKVIEIDPGNTLVYGLLANYYFNEEKPDAAKSILLKAYEYNPQVAELHYAILRSFIKEGLLEEANLFVQQLKSDAPKAASTWVGSGLLSIQKKDYQNAETDLNNALDIDKDNYVAWVLSAATQLKLEKRDAALQTIEDALTKFPDSRTMLVQSAQLHLSKKNNDKAEQKAVELERLGENALASFIRADILNNQGKTEAAYKLLTSEWDAHPNHRLAIATMRYAKLIEASLPENFIQTWEAVAPDNPQAYLAIGNIYLAQGNTDAALNYFEKVLTLDENNVIALNNAAWFLQEKGQSKKALELANQALRLAPENAAVLDTAGWIKYQNGDGSSVALLKKAATLAPKTQEIQEHYAKAKARF